MLCTLCAYFYALKHEQIIIGIPRTWMTCGMRARLEMFLGLFFYNGFVLNCQMACTLNKNPSTHEHSSALFWSSHLPKAKWYGPIKVQFWRAKLKHYQFKKWLGCFHQIRFEGLVWVMFGPNIGPETLSLATRVLQIGD